MPSPVDVPPPDAYPPEPWRQAQVPPEPGPGDVTFACPRCGDQVQQASYAPCAGCRADLRSRLGGDQRVVAEEDYVPKVNVTPDAVALKD